MIRFVGKRWIKAARDYVAAGYHLDPVYIDGQFVGWNVREK